MKKITRNLFLAAFLTASTAVGSHAHAQADLTFSGGSGSPLEFSLDAPVTYTITSSNAYPLFDFQGADSTGVYYGSDLVSLLTYSVNGTGSFSLSSVYSGSADNAVASSDIYTFGNPGSLSVGDIVTLNPGTVTTVANVGVAAPANGDFTTFITDGDGVLSSTYGVAAAPEPGTWAMLAIGGTGMVGLRRLRRRQSA